MVAYRSAHRASAFLRVSAHILRPRQVALNLHSQHRLGHLRLFLSIYLEIEWTEINDIIFLQWLLLARNWRSCELSVPPARSAFLLTKSKIKGTFMRRSTMMATRKLSENVSTRMTLLSTIMALDTRTTVVKSGTTTEWLTAKAKAKNYL